MVAHTVRTATIAPCYVGADVSKAWVDFADSAGRTLRADNTVVALSAALSRHWSRDTCANLVCEATGGYERALLTAANALDLPIRRIHPSRARAFAKASARLAKTDRIDAAVLADLAAFTVHEPVPLPPSPAQHALGELMSRLGQLKDQRHAERCRAEQTNAPIVRASIATMIDLLDQQIKTLTKAMEAAVAADAELANKALLLRSCKGIGVRSTHAILAWLPEIGTLNRRTVAALVGVAPITRHSGSSIRTAAIGGGRKPLRDILFMAALTASRHNPVFKTFYDRLRSNGKPHKIAIVAVLRKLVTALNAIIKSGQPFQNT